MVPMFLIIGIWGSRQRKIHAVYQFFFYTLFGSIFLLLGILLLFSTCKTLDLRVLNNIYLTKDRQIMLFFFFFLGFCIKIPMVPFHI
jgi:NADH-ubiquinone oxidoreductase chain 4